MKSSSTTEQEGQAFKEYLLYSTLLSQEEKENKELTKTQKDELVKACADLEDDEKEAICLLIYEHYRQIDGDEFNYEDVFEDIGYKQEKKNSKINLDSLEPQLQHILYRFVFSTGS